MATENSAFSQLLLELQNRIDTEIGTNVIRMVDEDKGQLESYDPKTQRPPVSWPCVLIGFDIDEPQDMGENTQRITGRAILRLGFPPFSMASSWMPLSVKQKALRYFDYEWLIYKALNGWQPDKFDVLAFRGASSEKREDPIRVRELLYEIGWEETSAQTVRTTIPKPPMEWEEEEEI
ncbi:MAG: hypothetical protein ACK4EY_15205 [Flavipsychrobacter sp.]